MSNHIFLKTAYIQIKCEPDNIVKVAGVLSKIKNWVLGLFDEGTRKQIGVIDSKYESIKYLLLQLQHNIDSIEESIDNVNLSSYDANVTQLIKTIEILQNKLENAKTEINEAQIPNNEVVNSNKHIIEIFKSKTLRELGITTNQIRYNNIDRFFNSLRGASKDGNKIGPGNVLKHFQNEAKLNRFIEAVQQQHVAEYIPESLLNFKIVNVLEPTKRNNTRMINIGKLNTHGALKVKFEGIDYNIIMQIYVDVFVEDTSNINEEIKNGIYTISSQFVWGVNITSLPNQINIDNTHNDKIQSNLSGLLSENDIIDDNDDDDDDNDEHKEMLSRPDDTLSDIK